MGPLAFADKSYTFDPNPEVYARFGLQPPPGRDLPVCRTSGMGRALGGPGSRDPEREAVLQRRAALEQTLERAKSGAGRCGSSAPTTGPPRPPVPS